MKRKWTLQALLAWMIGLLWICCGSIPAAASQNENVGREKIRVVINDYPLYFQLHQDGNVTGYVQEYLRDIAEYTGWEYEYVELNLAEAIRALENGTVDILPGNQYTPERAQIMDFSREPMGQGETVLCVLPHDRKYAFNDFAGYGGMRIAALKGSVRIGQMQEKLRQYGTSAVFLEYDSDMASKEALLRGEVDAVLMSSIRCEEGYKIVARVSTAPLYFALNKNKPFLKQKIDAAIEEIHLKRPYYEAELNEKYYGGIKEQLSLSDEEKEYVKSAGVITVAVSDGMKPVEYYDKSLGEYRGIIIDSLNYISEYTGLQFRFVEKQGRSMLREQLKDGTVKIVGSVVGDETIAAELGVNLTEPYYSMEVATIINQKIEEDHAKDLCVAVKEDSIFPEKMARSLGYTNISYYPTLEDCLRAVNRGAQDVTFVPSYSRDRLLKHSYYKNLVSYNIAGETYDFCVGISEGADKLLYSIINKAVRSISEKTKNEIVVANITQNNDKDTWHDFFSDHMQAILTTAFFAVCIIALILYSLFLSRKRMNESLQEMFEQAEYANRAKNDFLSRMSHDMRTPMNAIIGLAVIGQEETKEEMSREYFGNIRQSADFLLGLISDVLDTSKIESEEFTLHPNVYSSTDFRRRIESTIIPMCEKKKIQFRYVRGNEAEEYVKLDSLRFEQIVFNLLTNAVKFTPEGGTVEIIVTNLCKKGTLLRKQFVIRDSGIGMDPQFQEHMYEAFAQENSSLSTRTEGSGLGLTIVKKLVDLMGGTISCTSIPGSGTEFIIELDMELCTDEPKKKRTPSGEYHLRGRHVLLCEDHPLNTQIAVRLLEKQGMRVTCAKDGAEGVALFSEAAEGTFDAVLMDVRMPVMDGLAATKAIRALARKDAAIVPIIAMTANAYEEDKEKSRAAGMNEHLAKPIEPQRLYEVLEQYIGQ